MISFMKQKIKSLLPPNIQEKLGSTRPAKLLYYSEKYLNIKKGNPSIPDYIDVSPTYKCNYKCFFCQTHSYIMPKGDYHSEHNKLYFDTYKDNRENNYLDIDVYKHLVDDCEKLGINQILLSGIGEPLLHPDILDMIQYTKEKGLHCSLVTNAAYLTEEKINKIIEYKLDLMFISLNALELENYKIINGINNEKIYNKVFDIIPVLSEKTRNTGLTVKLSFVINSSNYQEIPKYFEFCDKYGFEGDFKAYVEKYPTGFKLDEDMVDESVAQLEKLTSRNYNHFKDIWYDLNIKKKLETPCLGSNMLFINSNGDVFPCTESKVLVGNLYKTNLEQVLSERDYKDFRLDSLNFYKEKNPLCDCESCFMVHQQNINIKNDLGNYSKLLTLFSK